jgi:AraC-like DNA-binding protein
MPIGALAALPEIMSEHGQDGWKLLASYGITPRSFERPLQPLPTVAHGRVLQAAGEAMDCDHLGLLVGERATMEHAGPLRFVVLYAQTVRDAVDALLRFSPIWYPGLTIRFAVEGEYAVLALKLERGSVPGSDQILTALLVANVKIIEMIVGHAWRPTSVRVAHREPRTADPYRRFFRSTVLFDQPQHEIWFPAGVLDRLRSGADRKLETYLHEQLAELKGDERADLLVQVRRAIQSLLPTGACTAERVAALFHVHRYTLHRHLARLGTSFETLLDETRRDLACQLLAFTDMPLGEIAFTLGYTNPANFTRAFRRWEHETPSRWRRSGAAAGAP